MAYVRWLGSAQAISQTNTFEIGASVLVGERFKVICGKSFVEIVAASTDESLVAAQLLAALVAASSEFLDATYTLATTVITATGIAGIPITFAVVTDSVGGTLTMNNPQAATGPNFYSNVANWSTGVLPVATDDVVIDGSLPGILYDLSPTLVTFNSLTISSNFTGSGTTGVIGLAETNPLGYQEYRTRFLTINSTKVTIGTENNVGSSRINLNLGTVGSEVIVLKSLDSSGSFYPVSLLANSASTDIIIYNGYVELGDKGDVTGQVRTVTVSDTSSLSVLKNITIVTLRNTGIVNTNSNIATLINYKGLCTILDVSVTTLLDIRGGTVEYLSDNTLPAVYLAGILDVSKELRAKTITATTLKKGGKVVDPYTTITFTAISVSSDVVSIQS